MSFIDVEIESNVSEPINARFRVYSGEKVGALLDKIDFEDLGDNLDSTCAILKFNGKEIPVDSTFDDNHIGENDVIELTIRQ